MKNDKSVIIIDDETDFCLLLTEYLTRRQYKVFYSHTLTDGVKLIKEVQPDVLFLDNNLPDGLGWANAPEIAKKMPFTQIILMSAFHPEIPNMPDKAMFRIIEKPLSMKELDKQLSNFP